MFKKQPFTVRKGRRHIEGYNTELVCNDCKKTLMVGSTATELLRVDMRLYGVYRKDGIYLCSKCIKPLNKTGTTRYV